ncbi:MmcQ/YjbR family DNA-binding protein [Motilimonas pumila]|uniref:MmcQ/YjbR family DNA-binding protein n=1 Tax=Motilimonas pumila TaxID=2303987 RepID=A0A418YA46_9GAMM|nr:MmcQ/YjbR family DNA-binding protein [Motilimonas pumila]RJG39183.1 MmcQ/YjbR family DNA-binding protein [Motilimonas pumila]
MDESQLCDFLAARPEAELDYPFGPEAKVYKVKGKLFAIVSVRQQQLQVNLKCDPQQALMLRDIFTAVLPGYHMNKKHWNTVLMDNTLARGEIERMIEHSYGLVVKSLPKSTRSALVAKHGEHILAAAQ